jgi:hypothetical protein
MLSIKDQEHFLALVEFELTRMRDKLSDPSTSPDDMAHYTAPAVAQLRARVASSIVQDQKAAGGVQDQKDQKAAGLGLEIQEEFSRLARAAFVPAQPEWVCEDELTITLRRMRSIESHHLIVGPVPNGLHIDHNPQKVTCTLSVNCRAHSVTVQVSDSGVIRGAIDQFRRRADGVGAGGDRVDAQSGWTW